MQRAAIYFWAKRWCPIRIILISYAHGLYYEKKSNFGGYVKGGKKANKAVLNICKFAVM